MNNLYTMKIQNVVPFYFDNIVNQSWSSDSLFHSLDNILKSLERQVHSPLFKLEKQKTDDNYQHFTYLIHFKNNNLLSKYFDGMNLSIVIDWNNNIVNGGFTINHKFNENQPIDSIIEDIYLKVLMKNFISKQFFPLNMQNLVDIISEYNYSKNNNRIRRKNRILNSYKPNEVNKGLLNFKNVTVDDIYDNWSSLIERKYLNFDEFSNDEIWSLKNGWLFANLTIYSLIAIIVNTLKLDFRKISKVFTYSDEIISSDESIEKMFYLCTNFVKQNFNPNDYHSVFNIGKPLFMYSLYNDDELIQYYDENFFMKDSNLRSLYILCMTPEVFGMDENSSHFIEFSQLKNVIFKTNYGRRMSEAFEEQIDVHTCEESFSFRTFTNENSDVFIMSRGENDLFDEYFWSQTYLTSKNQIYLEVNYEVNAEGNNSNKTNTYWKSRHELLDNLIFNEYDSFLMASDLKDVVFQMEKISNYKASWKNLVNQIFTKENSNKQQYEHKVLSFALIVAAVIGFINFFAMIFTVLSVGKDGGTLDTTNIVVISITSVLAAVLLGIALVYFISLIREKIKLKKVIKDK